jgi:hypothetical protein
MIGAVMKRLVSVAIGLICLLGARARGSDSARDQRIAVLRQEMETVCDKFQQLATADKLKGRATRELTHIAHDMFALGRDPGAAESLMERAFAEQPMDPQSARYGTVPWSVGVRAASEDPNAIEFTCLPMGTIMTRYHAQLSLGFIRDITPHLRAALAAIRQHNVPVAYTNIYLMKISNLLLLGQAIGDDEAVKLGLGDLNMWIDYTRTNGIGEYNSPTYGETQINSAQIAYANTSNPEAQAKLKTVLDFLWADVCANYYPPTEQVAGASSRDYDFLYGTGPLDRYLYIEGLRSDLPTGTLINDMSGPFCDAVESPYVIPAKILALAKETEKSFVSGYGPGATDDRTLCCTGAFSVGTAGAAYGPQDREIGIRFGSAKKLPVVSVFLDRFDDPDGSVRIQGKDSHSKPEHIRLTGAVAQDKGSVLAVYDLAANVGKNDYQSLGLNLVLPAHADGLWLDGKKILDSDLTDHPCTDQSVVIVREGKAALAARIFGIGGFDGFGPTYFLKHDIAKGNAFRLVADAYKGDSQVLRDAHLPGAVVIDVQTCETDAEFARFMAGAELLSGVKIDENKGVWGAKFGTLNVGFDAGSGRAIAREIDGKDVHHAGPGVVKGWDLGGLLLGN